MAKKGYEKELDIKGQEWVGRQDNVKSTTGECQKPSIRFLFMR